MACKYICDNCGKESEPDLGFEDWIKPESWFIRPYIDKFQDACSLECAEALKEKFPAEVTEPVKPWDKDEVGPTPPPLEDCIPGPYYPKKEGE